VRNRQVPNPPLARNCNREDSAINGHWETEKAGRKIARKPGDFGIHGLVKAVLFFHASRKSLRETVFTDTEIFSSFPSEARSLYVFVF
jgi:hypothetical protein